MGLRDRHSQRGDCGGGSAVIATIVTAPGQHEWPTEVDFILSALEAARQDQDDARVQDRVRYHVRAELRLFSDGAAAEPRILYTRDVSPKGVGFISQGRLPLGYGGRLRILGPLGQCLNIDCTLLRCHEAIPGWFEGALYFNRDQWAFGEDQWSADAAM
jgi:hypothetical protein